MADLVAGRYRIIKLLGEGGMGEVYSAQDERLKRTVALKRLHVYGANQTQLDTFHARFEREAVSMAQFIHPYIVPVYDFGSDDDGVYLVMGLMAGGSLKDRMGKIISVQDAAKVVIPVANALGYVHSHSIVHRDVKPHNILFNEHDVPMISDFGIVKLVESDGVNLTSTGTGVGTPAYMAPEQMTTKIDARADQYSLGIILYEMLTGRIPFEGETPVMTLFLHRTEPLPDPRLFSPTLSDAAVTVLRTTLAKNPEDRYTDMNAFADALQKAASQAPLDVLADDAGFVETAVEEPDATRAPILNQTMVGAPSLFTKDPVPPTEVESQALEEFIQDSDAIQTAEDSSDHTRQSDPLIEETAEEAKLHAVTAVHASNIAPPFEVPMDETLEEEPRKHGKDRKKKKDLAPGEKRKRRIPKWIIILSTILFVFCLLTILLQRCADLGATLEQLSSRATDASLGDVISQVSTEVVGEINAGLNEIGQDEYFAVEIAPQELLIVGDPGMQAATEKIVEKFLTWYPDWNVNVAGGGSVTALTAIGTDKADIGMSRRILTDQDWERFPKLFPIPVALNPMGVVCNEATTIDDLMLEDLRRILSGEVKNWREFGGPDAPIKIYVADFDSDATQAFTFIVMGEDLVTDQIEFVAGPDQVVQAVKQDPNGIGILNRMVETGSLQYISINGVEPSEKNILNRRYMLAYELLYITHGDPDEKEWIFLDFVFSPRGAGIIRDFGLVPMRLDEMEPAP